ncbi:unnamed protein product, partial [Darwinula stevensoni]
MESARRLGILQAVGFLIFFNSCSRGTSQKITIVQKIFYELGGVNAAIRNSLLGFAGFDLAICADSCARNVECVAFSLETNPSTTVCQLGSESSTVVENPPGMTATLYSTRSVPRGYNLAMVTDKMHFLKPFTEFMNYTDGLAACKADGADHLVQDDKGIYWHDYTVQYATSNIASPSTFWLGGDDLDGDHIYTWNDGTLVSASPATYWDTIAGQPSFAKDGIPEQCMQNYWFSDVGMGFHGFGVLQVRMLNVSEKMGSKPIVQFPILLEGVRMSRR